MRFFSAFALVLASSLGAYAQQHRGGASGGHGLQPRIYTLQPTIPYRTYGSTTGFGSVLFPGTGNAPPLTNPFTFPFTTSTTFVERLGNSISGVGYTGVGRGFHGGGGGFGGYPIAYPVVVGGGFYGDNPYAYQQQQPPNITIVMPPQQTAPPVTINQYGPEAAKPEASAEAESGIQTYQAPSAPRPEPSDDQVMFFIALKDSSVYTAVAYWVEDGTLHYITPQGRHNQVSLDLVDRQTSARLNEGRKVEFRLPPPR